MMRFSAAWGPDEHPFVTVVMAVRNEERFIARSLEAVRLQSYPGDRMEILVADGDSTDLTPTLVSGLAARDPRIRMLRNPLRRTAGGLNVGIRAARGDVIVLVDGHCRVPRDYLASCVSMLREGKAECVGGPVRAVGETLLGRAIALAMSTPFGVGSASFRYATREGEVDHLPFAAFRRDVFERLGGFDETLLHNHDDDFTDRLRRAGGRIVADPGIGVEYWNRQTLGALWRQYHGYGFWKVRVIGNRGGRPWSPRHLAPPALVLALAASLLAGVLAARWEWLALVGGAYLAFLLTAALWLAARGRGAAVALVPAAMATLQVAYGVGFVSGMLASPAVTRRESGGGPGMPPDRPGPAPTPGPAHGAGSRVAGHRRAP